MYISRTLFPSTQVTIHHAISNAKQSRTWLRYDPLVFLFLHISHFWRDLVKEAPIEMLMLDAIHIIRERHLVVQPMRLIQSWNCTTYGIRTAVHTITAPSFHSDFVLSFLSMAKGFCDLQERAAATMRAGYTAHMWGPSSDEGHHTISTVCTVFAADISCHLAWICQYVRSRISQTRWLIRLYQPSAVVNTLLLHYSHSLKGWVGKHGRSDKRRAEMKNPDSAKSENAEVCEQSEEEWWRDSRTLVKI